jgi:hypothetical protein
MGWVELLEVFLAFDGWKLGRRGRLGSASTGQRP